MTAAAEGGNEAVFVDVPNLMGGKVSGRGIVSAILAIHGAAKTTIVARVAATSATEI